MGVKILTVLFVNGDSSKAGSVLFNSNRINNMKLFDTDDTLFDYPSDLKPTGVIMDQIWVDETLTTADDVYAAASATFYTLPIHDDLTATSATTNKVVDPNDIAKGVGMTSNVQKSFLWIQDGGKVNKVLVAKSLGAIEDYIMTGTTTTSTTTTSTTTTAA